MSDRLVSFSRDILSKLAHSLGNTVAIGAIDEQSLEGVVLASELGRSGFSYYLDAQQRFAIDSSVLGKVMLASYPAVQQKNILNQLPQYTQYQTNNKYALEQELAKVKKQGYACDFGEYVQRCVSVGVPVIEQETEQVLAVIWTMALQDQLPVCDINKVVYLLAGASQQLSSLLTQPARANNRDYIIRVIDDAKALMDQQACKTLNIEKLAEELNVGYSWFRKVFKEQEGIAPAEYHKKARVNKAVELLKDSQLSIRDIALMLGFSEQNNFSAFFKKCTTLPPSTYRAQRNNKH